MIWNLETMFKWPCYAIFKNNLQHIININEIIFLSFLVNEPRRKYIVHQFCRKQPQIKRKLLKKTMIWTLEILVMCPCYTIFKNYLQYIIIILDTFFHSFHVSESRKKYIVRQFNRQQPPIKRKILKKNSNMLI